MTICTYWYIKLNPYNNGIVVKNTTWLHHQLDSRKKVVGFTLKNLQFEPLHVNPDAYWLLQFLARLRYWAFLLNFNHLYNCWRKVDFETFFSHIRKSWHQRWLVSLDFDLNFYFLFQTDHTSFFEIYFQGNKIKFFWAISFLFHFQHVCFKCNDEFNFHWWQ